MAVKVSVYGTADMKQIERARGELDKLEAQARGNASGFAGSMGRLGGSISGVGKSMAGLGDTMTTKVTLPLLAVGAGLGIATKAAAEDAAAQATLAQNLRNAAGATDAQVAATETWIAAQGKALGVTDDQLRPALATLATATGDVTKAQGLAALAMDLAAAKGIPVETAAKAIAKAYAGQGGALGKLLPGIDQAALKSGDFAQVQSELARLTGGAAATAANTQAGAMQRNKVAMDEAVESLGASLLPLMRDLSTFISTTVVPAVEKFTTWFGKLDEGTKRAGLGFGLLVAAAGPVLSITGRLVQGVGALVSGVGRFAAAVPRALGAMAGLGRSIASGAAAVGRMTVSLATNAAAMAVSAARWLAATAAAIAHRAATLAGTVVQAAATAAQWLWNAALAANPIGLIVIAIAALVGALVYAWNNSETFRNIVLGAWEKIKAATTAVFGVIKTVIGKVWDWIKLAFSLTPIGLLITHWDKIRSVTLTVFAAIRSAISTVWEWIKTAFRLTPVGLVITHWEKLKAITLSIMAAVRGAIDTVIGKVREFATNVATNIGQVVSWFGKVKDKVLGAFSGAITWLVSVGKNIVTGLWSGIQSMWDTLLSNIRNSINLLPDFVKKFLGISSPSKVFAAIGRNITDGMRVGIEEGSGSVTAAMLGLASGVTGTATVQVAAFGRQPALAGAGSTSSRNVVVQPGAVVINANGAEASGVQAAVDRAFERLLRELMAS